MGNCQAIDNASLVLQHPCGKVERLYSPVPASQIMKLNPGHYVALLLTTITTTAAAASSTPGEIKNNNKVRITRIKLLRATDTLNLGHAYRLITTQEVMKGLCAKKYAKMNKVEPHQQQKIIDKAVSVLGSTAKSEIETKTQVSRSDRNYRRLPSGSSSSSSSSSGSSMVKSRGWHPSLKSISEAAGS